MPNWLHHLQLGDLPTWIAAVATVGALVAAAIAAIATGKLLEREAERDQLAAAERRATQANRVAAWYGGKNGIGQLLPAAATRDEVGTFLRNASESPVYDLVIEYYFPIRNRGLSFRGTDHRYRVLPPTDQTYFVDVAETISSNLNTYLLAELVVALIFRDSAGRTWRRDTQGQLSEITDPDRHGREEAPPPEPNPPTV